MKAIILPLALAAALLAAGCGRDGQKAAHDEHDGHDHTGHDHAAVAAVAQEDQVDHDDHAGHDHGAAEASDLDQPVETLFAASCEHAMKTHACDECRYEVGVARAPADLFTGGLLHKAVPARAPVRAPLELTGEVLFDERRVAHLAPPAEGVVRRVLATVGDRVRRGDVLVEIESGEAAQAAAALRGARAQLAAATQAHERATALREQGIAAQKDLQAAAQELEAARIRVDAAAAQAARLGVTADANVGDATGLLRLRAPRDGTVLTLHAVGGERAHTEEVMATIGDIDVVWVRADLYERDLARLRQAGDGSLPAAVSVRAWPGQSFAGTVDFVSPSIDEASRTVKLRVTVPNPDRRLLAGMFAAVQVLLTGDGDALVLPLDAVLEDEGRRFVFTHHEGDYYVRRPVTTGRTWGDIIEITGGLRGDETVVAEGAFLLKSDVLRSKMGAGCAD
ncbi:MAG: efflux RND transporter periplasmic adaptor subunit [bacterium]|nr:efflux RND transporter periplasmic adaptor subunit [bacterium]